MKSHLFKYFFCLIVVTAGSLSVSAQDSDTTNIPENWHMLDPYTDHVQGISAERAYQELLQNQPSRKVIVAIIDSGIDINHEDLKGIIWTNEDEVIGNGIDDDKNGYIDDIHGWNFIGGKDGNVNEDTNELTREYVRLHKKFENTPENKVGRKEKEEYERYKSIEKQFETAKEKSEQQYATYKNIYSNIRISIDTLKSILHTDTLTAENLKSFNSEDPTLLFAKGFLLNMLRNIAPSNDLNSFVQELADATEYFESSAKYAYNEDFDPRSIVGDHYDNPYEKGYGNNDVTGPFADHGTHVAGIIGAIRNNSIGVNGIADNVQIMSVRAVPNGDERDKDVANAILYAVDNGAKIINMSFGKSLSPQKEAVDKAVKYAEQKGVLMIHAAGNDGDDIDKKRDYPTRYYLDGKEAKNWLEVGASSWGENEELASSFSNYGSKSVDLFAPGVDIYSTVPGNKYKSLDGTSMASPVVAGVAAVLFSYFPDLTTSQVKEIIRASTRKFDQLKVQEPGSSQLVEFSKLSNTGGLLNLYEAVKMAQKVQSEKLIK